MHANFYMKTFNNISKYRLFVWPIVLLVSIGGFFIPKLGLIILPMFAFIMISGFFKGRYWCGNLCPRGAFLDIPMRKTGKFSTIKKIFKNKYFRIFVLVLLMGMFTKNVIKAFNHFGQNSFLDKLGMAGVMMCVVTTGIGIILSLTINPRSWCTFCPMGTVQKALHKVKNNILKITKFHKKITLTQPEQCVKCGNCSRVCPMQLSVHHGDRNEYNQIDNPDCIKCSTCIKNCKANILSFKNERNHENYNIYKLDYETNRTHKAIIYDIEDLREDTKEITFEILGGHDFNFQAGQFISIKVDEDKHVFRAYSISKPNAEKRLVTITVKLDKNGYGTPLIFQFAKGQLIEILGPMGDFTLNKEQKDNKVFVAGGIGITPFLSLVLDALHSSEEDMEIHLLHGSNSVEELIYKEYFAELEKQHANFKYSTILLNPDKNWKGKKGYVTDLIKNMNLKNSEVYICGPEPMIDNSLIELKNKSVPDNKIKIDKF